MWRAGVGLEPKPGSKTAPMKVKGWETRKLPDVRRLP